MSHLGRLPLPRDERDYKLSAILPPRGSATRKFWKRPLMLDQGATGTCEGNAWTGWLADAPVYHPDIPDLNDATTGEYYARQLYVEATGDDTLEQGAYTRQILKVLVSRGLVGAYHRAASVDEVITAILTLGPVCFGSNWYRSMDDVQSMYGNSYIYVDEATGSRGGHEYILDAIDLAPAEGPPYARLHNSWGSDYGHDGTVRVTIEDLNTLFVGDAYIATELA
jgi:hypothetical protein